MKYLNSVILNLKSYDVPQYKNYIKLNQNEVPFDYPAVLKEETFEKLRRVNWNRYPDNNVIKLTKNIADYSGVKPGNIICGNGSNELIQTLISALPFNPRKILVNTPGFSMYERVGEISGGSIIRISLKPDFTFDVEKIIESSKEASLITLVSPNNPTGTILKQKELIQILDRVTIPVLLDEAYFEFYPNDNVKLLQRYPNLIILRTFSKAFASASMRLGYLIGNEEMISELRKAKLPFSVGIFQQTAAIVALENKEFFQDNIIKIINERERVRKDLIEIDNFIAIRSFANFILFRSEGINAETMFKELVKSNILIRSYSESPLSNWLRVTIGTNTENTAFLKALKKINMEKKT